MHAEYNASRAIAILVTTALLLNAMMPTLAHAATYLQGTEVNASTLIRDAYVAVTYYDSKGKQKLEKGWIDAVGETSFTIRFGTFLGKKIIAYDKVVSAIMSDESTVRAKQMNEVNRFIRNMRVREIEQAKKGVKTRVEQPKREAKAEFETGEIDSSTVKPGAFVEVIYGQGKRDPVSGEWERLNNVKGYVKAVDAEYMIIGERFWEEQVVLDRIQKLIISDSARELDRSGDEIGGAVATAYRSVWTFLGVAPGTVILIGENFSISFVHVFAGFELGTGQFSTSIEAGYGAPIEALEWGVGVFSINGNFHLIKKHRLNTSVPFLSIGYTALVREGSTSLFNVGAGTTWWSHKGRSLRLEVRDHITWSGGEGAHALEFRISAVL